MVSGKGNPPRVDSLAAETQRGADDAAGLPARVARYSKARRRALDMADFIAHNTEGVKEHSRLSRCGNYLVFRHYYTRDIVRLHAAEFCKQHLLCPLCAIRRGAKLMKAYLERWEYIRAGETALKPFLVTFTVKNGPDLDERMGHLRRSLQKLHKRRTGTRQRSECRKAEAGVWSYEVTNRGKGWHPHAHAIWLCATPPDQAALRAEWEGITGDSFMVDVRPIAGDPVEGFCEVFKYALKFSELSPLHNWEAYKVLHGCRLIAAFGGFYGLDVPDQYLDEPLPEDLPFVDLLFRYVTGVGYSFVPSRSDDVHTKSAQR